jgi:Protein of unknown function (DUF2806)
MTNGGIGDLSKPVTVLIEKISEAIGGIVHPYQIKRIAEAEAEAAKIQAISQIEINELQRRALIRFVVEETNKQSNIEAIIDKSIPELASDSHPSDVNNDWIVNFFDKCKLISDEEMQTLWAKVLAGEANKPGRYSKRTINFLANMDKADADMFCLLCKYVWDIGGDLTPIIFNLVDKIYDQEGLNYDVIKHLQDIGLIIFEPYGGFNKQKMPQNIYISYQGNRHRMELPHPKDNKIEIGKVLLSKVGKELVSLAGNNPLKEFSEYVIEQFKTDGCKVYTEVEEQE